MKKSANSAKRVVIVGGGFAGINLALGLAGNKNFLVTLVDKNNYNYFSPLLYQVATGMLQVSSITLPFRTLFKGKSNLIFRIGELLSIDSKANSIQLTNGQLEYDHLVLAMGTTTNFFDNGNIQRNALPMKTLNDALKIRNTLLENAEMAAITEDEKTIQSLRNIVIAGGGPAGVEIAGMLAELKNRALQQLYPSLKISQLQIYLVEGENDLLSGMRTKSQDYALKSLKKLVHLQGQ